MLFTTSSQDLATIAGESSFQPDFPSALPLASMFSLQMRVLDEIDCGILLVTESGHIRYANRAARRTLSTLGAFCVRGESFDLRDSAANSSLRGALRDCCKGKRSMVTARNGLQIEASVAVVPISLDTNSDVVALLTLGKCQIFNELSLQFFGKIHKLTLAEVRTLQHLCQGWPCKMIASQGGVALSTVRSHVRSILQKTEARGIRGIVDMVSSMAPMAAAL